MKDLLLIASGAGLKDGLNPCIFMTCAVFIVYGRAVKNSFLPLALMRTIFALLYLCSAFLFTFSPFQAILLKKSFFLTAKILYFVLGVCSLYLGVVYFKNWILLSRGQPVKEQESQKNNVFSVSGFILYLMAAILPVILSALSVLWPVDKYIFLLGNMAVLRNQWQSVMPLLATYALISMWPLWMVWAFIGIKNLRTTLLTIICSAIFFTASSTMIFIFK